MYRFFFKISNIIKRNILLNVKFMSMIVNSVEYLGEIDFILRESICPFGYYEAHYTDHNRFSKRSSENKIKSNLIDLKAYDAFLSECNNTASLNYNISICWQPFRIEYTLYFNESEKLSAQNLIERRILYTQILLDSMLTYRDENVILSKLNDSLNLNKVYLKVNSIGEECHKYLSTHNQTDFESFDECLSGSDNDFIFNQTRIDIFNYNQSRSKEYQGKFILCQSVCVSCVKYFFI